MKYFIYTVIIFVFVLIYTSLLSCIGFILTYINLLFIIFFSYILSRKSMLAVYIFFIAGVFFDLFTVTQIGVTSTNFILCLIVYTLISTIFPNERVGRILSILVSSIAFALISYITTNFISNNGINGILVSIPFGLINGLLVIILYYIIE